MRVWNRWLFTATATATSKEIQLAKADIHNKNRHNFHYKYKHKLRRVARPGTDESIQFETVNICYSEKLMRRLLNSGSRTSQCQDTAFGIFSLRWEQNHSKSSASPKLYLLKENEEGDFEIQKLTSAAWNIKNKGLEKKFLSCTLEGMRPSFQILSTSVHFLHWNRHHTALWDVSEIHPSLTAKWRFEVFFWATPVVSH